MTVVSFTLLILHVGLTDIMPFFQLDEDVKTILQRYEGIGEEDSEQTSNEATLSYLDYLANLDSDQVREEVAKRSTATKEHTKKLLSYVEKSGPFATTHAPKVIKELSNDEIDVVGEESKGTVNVTVLVIR